MPGAQRVKVLGTWLVEEGVTGAVGLRCYGSGWLRRE